jgi:hypothetical protein
VTELAFSEWLKRVDKALEDRIGMVTGDLLDMDYWSMYQDGFTPDEVAQMAVENAEGS